MANLGERIGGLIGGRSRERSRIVEEFVPSSAWTEDNNNHYLLVDLPGFQKEQVKLQVDDGGNITVTGERMLNNGKGIFFHQTFQPMPNSDIDNISGKFDGEILYATVPKFEVEEESEESAHDEDDEREHEHEHENENNHNGIKEQNAQERMSGYENQWHEETKVAPKADMSKKQWEQKTEALKTIMKVMRNNKEILVTAVLAFSLGFYIARNFDSAAQQ